MTSTPSHAVPRSWVDFVAVAAVLVALGFAFLSPPDANQGEVARLFYVHLPVILGATILMIAMVALAARLGLVYERSLCEELSQRLGRPIAVVIGLTLFVLTLGLNVLALYIVRRYREQYE